MDLKEIAKGLMHLQFKDSPNIHGILDSLVSPFQHLSDLMTDYHENGGITTATGDFLDIIGSWMGVERQGRLDEAYRTAILGRAAVEGADGTTERFIQGMKTLSGSELVRLFPYQDNTAYAMLGEGWSHGTADEIKRLAPVQVETRVLLSPNLEYQEFAELGEQDDVLHNQDNIPYAVVIDGLEYELSTSMAIGETQFGTNTIFAEDGVDVEGKVYPMAELVVDGAQEFNGFLVDNLGNHIKDHNNNLIKVTTFK